MKSVVIGSGLAVVSVAAVAFSVAAAKPIPDPPHVLDLRPGEFLSDTLDRSTYPLDGVRLASSGMSQILLTPFETERPRTPVITLRFGDDQTTLPYVPARGDLYSTQGLASELELGFYNFAALAHDGQRDLSGDFDADIIGSPDDDIDAIAALFDSLRVFAWSGDQVAFCAPEIAVAPSHAYCLADREIDSDWPTDQELRTALRRYQADLDRAWSVDDWGDFVDPDPTFVLGQWVTDDGIRISFSVQNRFEISHDLTRENAPPSVRKRGLRATIGIDAYLTGPARRTGDCFGRHLAEGDIIATLRRYTPLEAKGVHGGLMAGLLGVPELPENTHTLRKQLADLSVLAQSERAARMDRACDRLPELEDLAGYMGPR